MELTVDSFIFDLMVQDASCIGSMDGSATINISGGNPFPGGQYDVDRSWSPGTSRTNVVVTGPTLDPGTYSITVSDMINNCDTVFTFTIGSTNTISADIVVQPASCSDTNDGQATVTGLTNGVTTGPYDMQLVDDAGMPIGNPIPNVTTTFFTDLMPGNYGVVIVEGACSSDTIPFTITAPDPITIQVVNITPTGCLNNSMIGEITVMASGGTIAPGSDYTYLWNGGTLNGSTISNLGFGSYMLTVTDDNQCSAEMTINVPRATPPSITGFDYTGLSCGNDSTVSVEVLYTEGDGTVDFWVWSPSGHMGPIIPNQAPGTNLTVTIRDENFCSATSPYTVPSTGGVVIDSIRLESPICPGESNGQIAVFISGGTDPITYIWSTGDTTTFNLLPALSAGVYSVTVTSADTCGNVDTTVTLLDPPSLGFDFTNVVASNCSDVCTGEATLTPSGGLPGLPYEYIWESGLTDQGFSSTATGLCPGWQSVVITQDNICFFLDSVFIPAPDPLDVDTISFNNVSCHGAADGAFEIIAAGGTGPFMYEWNNGLPDGTVQGPLDTGTYVVTITDANFCSHIDTLMITQADTLIAMIDSGAVSGISCNNPNSGVITVEANGGVPGYTYQWSPDVSTSSVGVGLTVGLYQITVTDVAGCTDTTSYLMEGTDAVVASDPTVIPPPCFGDLGQITVESATGGVGGYTFSINGGATYPLDSLVSVPVGFYFLVVSDSANCSDTVTAIVEGPPPIDIIVLPEDPVVDLGDSIQLTVVVSNTQGPVDSIRWNPDTGLSCNDCGEPYVYTVVPGIYQVSVWDSVGCTATTDVFVDVNDKRNVYIPNVFTPNFDGRNDDFEIFTGQGVTRIEQVQVFNRWGELMQSLDNLAPSPDGVQVWDGSFRGEEMQPGVYVYVAKIEFIDGEVKVYRGDITLIK